MIKHYSAYQISPVEDADYQTNPACLCQHIIIYPGCSTLKEDLFKSIGRGFPRLSMYPAILPPKKVNLLTLQNCSDNICQPKETIRLFCRL